MTTQNINELTAAEKRKNIALKILNQLDIYKPYIKGFAGKEQKVCFFENFGGFWAYQEPELMKKIREIESDGQHTVYAVTHELTEFGEIWDLLTVTDEDISGHLCGWDRNSYFAFAYSWNVDADDCSEWGDIVVRSFGGGIRREF